MDARIGVYHLSQVLMVSNLTSHIYSYEKPYSKS